MARTVTLTGGSPWGLTLAGGKDFGAHLQISKLTPGGKAMRGGVKEKDYIIEINGQEMQGVTHHDAQQCIRSTGQTLSLTLSSEPPTKSPYAPSTQTTPTPLTQSSPQSGRPRPPPPPADVPVENTPPSTTTPIKPVQPTKPVVRTPLVSDDSETDPIVQSPAFKKITVEAPSKLSPKSVQDTYISSPPTQQMKNVTIEDGNTRKSTQRPAPPPNVPTTFTTTSMKLSSNTGPKGQSPIAKPAPPPSVKRPQPPPSPSTQTGSQSLPSPGPTSPSSKITSRQGVCEACQQPIRGAYSSAMNKVWHPEHFVCYRCQNPLSGGTFVFEEDKIFCNDCYEKQVAQICSLCRRPIVGPMVNATNRYYHQQCFKCSRCSVGLSSQDGFNMENGNLFCSDCYGEMYGATCFACKQKIGANELWVEALDHNWHPQCFVCGGCKRPLEGTRFFAKLGRPYCGQCS